jgi:prepilin-type N-terminal cleavage/methylation domain-containing protein
MRKKHPFAAFTLAEILVVITIVGILALWISNMNFSRLSQKQRVNIEATKIINLIEEARNNALIWKWVGTNLITPESWSITVENDSSSGGIISRYLSWAISHTGSIWNSPFPFSISNLECRTLDDSPDTNSWPFTITFTWSVWWISGCSNNNYKKLSFTYWVWNLTQDININTLNGVIEID